MSAGNRLMDDLSRVAGGALGALSGLRGEVEVLVRQRMERMVASMELVTREEFDSVQAMASEARAKQEDLEKKVADLEAKLAAKPAPSRARRTPTPTKSRPAKKADTPAPKSDAPSPTTEE
ncbi:MAG: accessory factor UbiK family protein [Rhodospirillum sp.]|nr:accessory factor UbiK family protein [Rhodospirillum sp.]MCF8491836.1 accessory factor UbiK family protein [Rhodospirillum sp.]MCF8503205.1 accessory factor UbiK family protein [Rhodospirillum sp.]